VSANYDFTRRTEPSQLPEWMDEPCTYADFRACLVDLAHCNRLTLAARPTLDFLTRLSGCPIRDGLTVTGGVAQSPTHEAQRIPLRILDVGFGGGDMLRRIERWAAQRNLPVQLTGIDLNPYAARAAAEFTPPGSRIQWLTGDAYSYTEPVDIILSALLTHHLETPDLVRFLAWSDATARRGWFINDLCREPVPARLFTLLAGTLRWHRFVQHDGPVSFRRSFREPDWQHLLTASGVPLAQTSLQRWTPGRLCLERVKERVKERLK
jgi:SAM-dependent methyltransferase